eukprot:384312_1
MFPPVPVGAELYTPAFNRLFTLVFGSWNNVCGNVHHIFILMCYTVVVASSYQTACGVVSGICGATFGTLLTSKHFGHAGALNWMMLHAQVSDKLFIQVVAELYLMDVSLSTSWWLVYVGKYLELLGTFFQSIDETNC